MVIICQPQELLELPYRSGLRPRGHGFRFGRINLHTTPTDHVPQVLRLCASKLALLALGIPFVLAQLLQNPFHVLQMLLRSFTEH